MLLKYVPAAGLSAYWMMQHGFQPMTLIMLVAMHLCERTFSQNGYDLSNCVLAGQGADAAPSLQAHFVKRILEVLLLHDFSGSPTGQRRPKWALALVRQRRELQPASHACTCLCQL